MARTTHAEVFGPHTEVPPQNRLTAVGASGPASIAESRAAIAIEELRSIADVDANEWDRMAGESALWSHGLLSTMEETTITGHAARYFLARKNLELAGAIVCHLEESSNGDGAVPVGGHRLDKMMLGKFAKFARYSRIVTFPCLMCGTQLSTRDPLVIRGGTSAAESGRIADALVEAIEQTAQREGWTVCFREVPREGSPLGAALTKRGYLRGAELPTACLELDPEWHSFDSYRQSLKKQHPHTAKTILSEVKRAKKAGLVIERIDDPAPHKEALHRLMEAHNTTHNGKPWPFRAEFFEEFKARMGNRAEIHGAKLDGRWVGVAVNTQGSGDVVGSMIGIDTEANRSAAVYFNLAYNHLIAESIASGRRRIYYGTLLWDLKARRGCGAREADFYLKGKTRLQQALLGPLVRVRSAKHDEISAPLRKRALQR